MQPVRVINKAVEVMKRRNPLRLLLTQSNEFTPNELRTRGVNTRLEDLLKAARSAHESAVLLRHTSHKITVLDDLKLRTTFIRAEVERVTLMIDELIGKIEPGEITMEDFSFK